MISLQILSSSTLPVQIATGILCASYWRGSWYILDHTLFPNDRLVSGIVSLTAGSALLGLQQYILSPSYNGTKTLVRLLPPPTSSISLRRRYIQTNRFIVLYGIATSCILLWRGTWLLWDEAAHCIADAIASYNGMTTERMSMTKTTTAGSTVAAIPLEGRNLSSNTRTKISDEQYEVQTSTNTTADMTTVTISSTHHLDGDRHHDLHHGESTVTQHPDMEENTLFYSGIASHVLATAGLLAMGRFASVMAPPANVSVLRDQFIYGQGKSFVRAVKKFIFHS